MKARSLRPLDPLSSGDIALACSRLAVRDALLGARYDGLTNGGAVLKGGIECHVLGHGDGAQLIDPRYAAEPGQQRIPAVLAQQNDQTEGMGIERGRRLSWRRPRSPACSGRGHFRGGRCGFWSPSHNERQSHADLGDLSGAGFGEARGGIRRNTRLGTQQIAEELPLALP